MFHINVGCPECRLVVSLLVFAARDERRAVKYHQTTDSSVPRSKNLNAAFWHLWQLEYQRQQLLADRQSFHMEQLKYAEMRARQQHFQQIQHQQHSQAGAPHSSQAASVPAPAPGQSVAQTAPSTPASQPAPSPAPPAAASVAPAPESQPAQVAHTSPHGPPGPPSAPHSSSNSSSSTTSGLGT